MYAYMHIYEPTQKNNPQRLNSVVCESEKSLSETENAFRKRGRRMVLNFFLLFLCDEEAVRDMHEDEYDTILRATCRTRMGKLKNSNHYVL